MNQAERLARRMKLRDLRILIAVAKAGSMSKAASELAMSQPVISKAISDLEHALSVQLFDRSPQGVSPTMYGDALVKCGIAVLDDLRRGGKDLEFLADPGSGEARIGCTEPLAAGFVAQVVDRLARQYPRAEFHIAPGDTVSLQDRELVRRTIDCAVVPISGLSQRAEIELEVLFDDRHVIMAGAANKWTRRRKIKLSDLLNEPWVLPPPGSTSGEYIAEAFRAHGCDPPHAQVVSFSIPLHQHMLATGRYITSLPRSMLQFAKHLDLKPLRLDSPVVPRPVGIITLRNRTLSPLAELFIRRARDLAKALTDEA